MAVLYNEKSNWNKNFREEIIDKLQDGGEYIYHIGFEKKCEKSVFDKKIAIRVEMFTIRGNVAFYRVEGSIFNVSGSAIKPLNYNDTVDLDSVDSEQTLFKHILYRYDENIYNHAYNFLKGGMQGTPIYPCQFFNLTKKEIKELGYKNVYPKDVYSGAKVKNVMVSKLRTNG